tara:strand:- start:1050 stop:1532 length:483 start_codon:yes stop_codon:yes gene_type:complete
MELLPKRYLLLGTLTELDSQLRIIIGQKLRRQILQDTLIDILPTKSFEIRNKDIKYELDLDIPFTDDLHIALLKTEKDISTLKSQHFIRFIKELNNNYNADKIFELHRLTTVSNILEGLINYREKEIEYNTTTLHNERDNIRLEIGQIATKIEQTIDMYA